MPPSHWPAATVLIFLNNDIEAREPGWLDVLAAQAMRPEVGAVGARLLYPDGRLQHCGVVIGVGGAADHLLAGLDGDQPGYLNMAICTRECAAVTGACLATRREVFDALGGFDESLGVDLNDIDYCLRAQRERVESALRGDCGARSTTNRPVAALPEAPGTSGSSSTAGDRPYWPVTPT